MLDFCSKHNIACDVEVIPIQKVNEAYDRVLRSDVRYRFVIDMRTHSHAKTEKLIIELLSTTVKGLQQSLRYTSNHHS
jgi:hypothetical protein